MTCFYHLYNANIDLKYKKENIFEKNDFWIISFVQN